MQTNRLNTWLTVHIIIGNMVIRINYNDCMYAHTIII